MKISDLRSITKLSQRQFANRFGIPVGTLRNWEQGISTPPKYVFQMIFTSIRRDEMINIETIRFVQMLDELAKLSSNGIEPFENARQGTWRDKIYYDSKELVGERGYRIVLDACVIDDPHCYHHDIISYYDSGSLEYKIRAIIDEEGAYIDVEMAISEDIIVVENGAWHFA